MNHCAFFIAKQVKWEVKFQLLEVNMGRKMLDIVGRKYGRLTVIEYAGQNHRGKSMWVCQCDCGKTSVVLGTHLTGGHTKSCGCYNEESTKSRVTTHGMSRTRLYNIWRGMLKRCNYEGATSYRNYGAKGISVCEEWCDYEKFKDWAISHGYSDHLTLDRIDNSGDYRPENCRWADVKTQMRNTSRNKVIQFRGETHCLQEWADILGMNYRTLQQRINTYGWTVERAFTSPAGNNGRK